jgi:hypothetical protein
MRLTLHELMEKLGVEYDLSPYETFPWSATDQLEEKTCSAEVRMNPDGDEVEAEIQLLFDNPEPGKPSVEQVLWLRATPHVQTKWAVAHLRIKGEVWENKVYNWEEKCCNFFRAVVASLALGTIPDIDELIEREMRAKERFGDQRGGGSGKSPKIRPAQLLDMKKGQGF